MKKRIRIGLAAALILAFGGGAAPANAEKVEPHQIAVKWDGETEWSTTVHLPGFPGPRIVPGDSGARVLEVRNDGPTAGTLKAWVVNVELDTDPKDAFYQDLTLNGQSIVDYYKQRTELATKRLEPGQSTLLPLAYDFPFEATSGNYQDLTRLRAAFDVELRIGGELPPQPTPTPEPSPKPSPEPTPPPEPTPAPTPEPSPDPRPEPTPDSTPIPEPSPEPSVTPTSTEPVKKLAQTGSAAWLVGAIALAAGGIGAMLMVLSTRRRHQP